MNGPFRLISSFLNTFLDSFENAVGRCHGEISVFLVLHFAPVKYNQDVFNQFLTDDWWLIVFNPSK